MDFINNRFLPWLMGLTTILRYFVIALLVHLAIVAILGSIKIVTVVPKIVASFTGAPLPPPSDDTMPDDPFAAYRDFDYSGPALGGGGGLGGKGPGGVPTAGGTPEQYQAAILSSDVQTDAPAVAEVIGVFTDAAAAISRPAVGVGGMGMGPVGGIGDALAGTGGIQGPGGGIIGARMGPARAVNLKKFGGSVRTEQAVMAALRWLKDNQQPDGSWKGQNPAISALAVLAFFGHGENADSPEFGTTISKGIDYLLKSVKASGDVNGNMYHQAIVGIALSEGLALTGSPMLRDPLERVLSVILRAQRVPKEDADNRGGWRYTPGSTDADMSVSGWQIMALKSARNAGIDVPDEAFQQAIEYTWNRFDGTGFGYTKPKHTYGMSSLGLLSLNFMGQGQDPRLKKVLDYLGGMKIAWDYEKANEKPPGRHLLYTWYYGALAIFQSSQLLDKPSVWTSWNNDFREVLIKNQSEDGHWDAPPDDADAKHGTVYTTAMCTLMLEVYYRYLPIYQVDQKSDYRPAEATGLETALN